VLKSSKVQGGIEMAALAGGLAALVLGIIGIIAWWGFFVKALMAGIPIMLILGGALAAYLGFEEIKDKRTEETFSDAGTDQKDEVIKNLKEEIQELKGEKPEDQKDKDEEKETDSTA
jgi:uncharacterized membrane protein YhiD involved in acid resistance